MGFVAVSGAVGQAQERVLDVGFWAAERSVLALGGLWEFHGEKLLEPAERTFPSELLVEISQPWQDLVPNSDLQKASYVLMVKGFKPRAQGYTLRINSRQSMTRVIASPRYAPERQQTAVTAAFAPIFRFLQSFIWQPLLVHFQPQSVDEIWMLVVQRWATPRDQRGPIPRLEHSL